MVATAAPGGTSSIATYTVTDPETGYEIGYAQRLDGGGQPIGSAIQITPSEFTSFTRTATLLSDGSFVVSFDYADPTDTSTPYPFYYLAYVRVDAQGTLLGTTTLGLDDFSASASVRSVALSNGAFAYVLDSTDGNFGVASETQTLGFVDAEGRVTTHLLYQTSHSDTPFPFAIQSPATIQHDDANDLVAVSFQVRYSGQNPDYPSPTTPTGKEIHQQIYADDGRLLRETIIGFDGQSDQTTSSITTSLKPGLHNLTLVGGDRITGYGNDLDNRLIGNAAGNHLIGGAGNDRLDGGLSADYLQGGTGADTFVFSTQIKTGFNSDLIADFTHSIDHIELSSTIFTGLARGVLSADHFTNLATGSATSGAHIVYDSAGNLSFDPDGSGPAAPYQFATLAHHPGLTATDFIVV